LVYQQNVSGNDNYDLRGGMVWIS